MGALAQAGTMRGKAKDRGSYQWRAAVGPAMLAVLAGLLHLYLAPQHMDHLGHGLFLAMAGIAQVAWGMAFWRKPSTRLYNLGVVLAGSLIALWAITRVVPAPFGRGGPGEVETFGVLSKLAEGLGLAMLLAMALTGEQSQETIERIRRTFLALLGVAVIGGFVLYGAGLAAERAFPWLGDNDNLIEQAGLLLTAPALPSASPVAPSAAPSSSSAPEAAPAVASAPQLLPVPQLMALLDRTANGPAGTSLDVLYLPPVVARLGNAELFQGSQLQPTAIFLVEHADHERCDVPNPDLLKPLLLSLDGGEFVKAYEVTALLEASDSRTSRYLFPLPQGTDPELLYQEEHTLTLIVPLGSEGESTMTWRLPLQLTR